MDQQGPADAVNLGEPIRATAPAGDAGGAFPNDIPFDTMRHLSLRARLWLATAVAGLGALALAALALLAGQRGAATLELVVEDNFKPLMAAQRIEGGLSAVRYRAAGVLLDHFPIPGTVNHLREIRTALAQDWDVVAAQSTDSDEETAALASLRDHYPSLGKLLDKLDAAYAKGDKDAIDEVLQSDWALLHKNFVRPLQALQAKQIDGANALLDAKRADNRTQLAIVLALALLTIGVVAVVMGLTARAVLNALQEAAAGARAIATGDLTTRFDRSRRDELGALFGALDEMQAALAKLVAGIRETADGLRTASAEVATGNQDLSQRTEQAASNLQQTASSIEQLSGTVRHTADSAREANSMAGDAAQVASRGGEVVAQVVATMDEINASSKKIADIIGVIDGIAFQTNILALNAAVEAARAGEQGRGFAVVAGEVRSLAQRSAEAAKEIKALIGTSVDKVETGSKLVGDAGATMSEIVASVRKVAQMIGEIGGATSQQTQGIGEVNGAVAELDRMTQQNAALVEQSAAAAESLKAQADSLAQAVAVFRLAQGPRAPVAA